MRFSTLVLAAAGSASVCTAWAQEPVPTPSPVPDAAEPAPVPEGGEAVPTEGPGGQKQKESTEPGAGQAAGAEAKTDEAQAEHAAGDDETVESEPVVLPAAPEKPAVSACSLEEPCVRADSQGFEKGRFWFTGFVDIRAGDVRVQADEVEVQDHEVVGGRTRILNASGNVVFLRGEERLSGDRLELDLGAGRGIFEEAAGFVQPGVFIEGRSIERVNAQRYRIKGARFTSCSQPNPRWSFSASSATVEVGHHISATNVLFKIKGVPAFYIPYFYYPIREDQRSTGFLFPSFGYSSTRGFSVAGGFFWAMGRSFDQTVSFENYSDFGFGVGHELRWALNSPSRGVFRSFALKPKGGGDWDYDLDWNALQMLPGGLRATVRLRQSSNLEFQQRINDSLTLATTRTQRASFELQKSFNGIQVRLRADGNDTFFPDDRTRVNRHLPGLTVSRSPRRIGRTGLVFGFEARAERLVRGSTDALNDYSRFDVAPRISRSFALPYLQATPRVLLRYTHYGASLVDGLALGPSVDRPFVESSLELRGPTFSRVFHTGGGYTDKIKHVIGPEITWRYRTRVDDFDIIPRFDGVDNLLGTHQVDYALVQRLLARRATRGGQPAPYEFLSWRISQSYFVDIAEGQNEFDPNYSSSVFGPEGLPDHNSPIRSQVRFRPTRSVRADFNLEYDVNFKQLRTLGLSTRLNFKRVSLNATWSRARRLAEQPENRIITRDTIRASTRLVLFPQRLVLNGSADYDFVRKNLIQTRAQMRYDVQCCGFLVEWIEFNLNQRDERQIRFSIELANIGAIGSFNGAGQNRRAGGGFR